MTTRVDGGCEDPWDRAEVERAIGFDDGFLAGWNAASPALEQRDEWIARRIVALILQHDYNGQLARSLATLGRPINWRTRLSPDLHDRPGRHDLWVPPDPA